MNSPIMKLISAVFMFLLSVSTDAQSSLKTTSIGEIHSLSVQAVTLGRFANGRLQNTQLKDFNKRVINDNATAIESLEDLGRQFNIPPPEINVNENSQKFESMNSKDFDMDYITKQIAIHKELVSLTQGKVNEGAPQVNNPFKNMLNRFQMILSNAVNLKSALTAKKSK